MNADLIKALKDTLARPSCQFVRIDREAASRLLAVLEAPAEGAGEQCVKVCPQCEGEGEYADGVDEAACSTPCTRCGSNGWIVDLNELRARSSAPEAREREAVTVSSVCGWCDGAKVVQSQTYGHVICAHCRGSGVETYTRTSSAAPSADKLRIAVEALRAKANGMRGLHEAWHKTPLVCDTINNALEYGRAQGLDMAADDLDQVLAALKAEGA